MSARDRDFAEWADLRGERMTVKIWGRVQTQSGWGSDPSHDAKGKGKEPTKPVEDVSSWQVLRAWDVNLNEMVILPEYVCISVRRLTLAAR